MNSVGSNTSWFPLDQLICYMTFLLLLVDSLTGFVLNTYGELMLSPSQLYKMLLIILLGIRVFTLSLSSTLYFSFLVCCFSITILYNFLMGSSDITLLKTDIVIAFKTLIIPLSFLYFKLLAQRNPVFTDRMFKRFIVINFSVLAGNLFLGHLGFGYVQYTIENIGTSGFFYAGNEVSVVLVILASVLFYLIWHKKRLLYLPFLLLCIYFAILLITKVAILGILLVSALIPLISERQKLAQITKLKLNYFAFLVILSPFIIAVIAYGVFESGLMDRMIRSYTQKQDFLEFILSGRDLYVEAALEAYNKKYNIFEYIFGVGKGRFTEMMTMFYHKKLSTVEIDLFDILFYFGIVGVILIFSFWFYLLFNSFIKTIVTLNFYAPAIFVMNLILLLISFTAGHVIHSGSAAVFIGFSNAMVFYSFQEPSFKNKHTPKN